MTVSGTTNTVFASGATMTFADAVEGLPSGMRLMAESNGLYLERPGMVIIVKQFSRWGQSGICGYCRQPERVV